MSNKVRVEVDYNGNTYLRLNDRIYIIFFDSENRNGIELSPISDSQYIELSELCQDYSYMSKHLIKGKIILSDSTLKGRVTKVLSELESEELDEETNQNMLNSHDNTFVEESFFRIVELPGNQINNDDQNDNSDYNDWDDDWDIDNTDEKIATSHEIEYRFSGVKNYERQKFIKSNNQISNETSNETLKFETSVYFSNILSEMKSHNDTLMIRGQRDSKIVTSCIKRTDGFCTKRLIFYSDSGHIKVHFPSSHSVYVRIVKNNSNLNIEFVDRITD